MADLLITGLTNLLMAALLAAIAVVAGKLSRNAALKHALWLLVFIKLITPPLVRVPISLPQPTANAASPAAAPAFMQSEQVIVPETPRAISMAAPAAPVVVFAVEPQPEKHEVITAPSKPQPEPPAVAVDLPRAPAAAPATIPVTNNPEIPWLHLAAGLWLAGAALVFIITARRIRQFQAFLQHARPADDLLQRQADSIAARMGVRSPAVWLVPGIVSPMLWSLGAARRLLVPEVLLARLTCTQRSTLLAHELAHLRRGDHHVRYLEALVLCLYWWCPLVWWARHSLHEAEEECCDAWVVWALPHLARDYALALVETLDFLCDHPAAPALASGIRPVPLLRRRLTMIMRGSSPRVLTAASGLALLCMAALLLPMLPSFAQEEKRDAPPRKEKERDEPPPPPRPEKFDDKGNPELRRLHEQLEQLHQQRRDLDRRLGELHRAIEGIRGGKDGERPRDDRPDAERRDRPEPRPDFKPFDRKPGEGPPFAGGPRSPLDRRLEELEHKMDRLMEVVDNLRRQLDSRPFPPKGPGFKDREQPRRPEGEDRPGGERPERPGVDGRERPEFRQPLDPRRETPDKDEPRRENKEKDE